MFAAAIFLCFIPALLLYPGAVQSAAASSISYCLTVLVPSLFPFMALSCYGVISPAAGVLGRPLGPLTRRVFRLPGCCAVPIFMSFIGGYPAGAKGAALLLEAGRITREQAGRMLLFCVNPGLAFTVTFLGAGVFGSARVGWLLFLSVTLTAALLGVLTGLRAPAPASAPESPEGPPPSGALIRSVSDSARSVLIMCACIVLFSGFTALLHASGIYQAIVRLLTRLGGLTPQGWAATLSFLLEVTGGAGDARVLGVGPEFFAFGLAFGGACVHLQVFSLFRELPQRVSVFLLFRFIHGLLAAGCFVLLARLLPGGAVQALAGTFAGGGPVLSGGWMGGASLVLMCAAFLLIAPEKAGKSS